MAVTELAQPPVGPPSEAPVSSWWDVGAFPSRAPWSRLANRIYADTCAELDAVIASRPALEARTLVLMRNDIITATRYSAKRDAVDVIAKGMYGWWLDAAWFVAAPLVIFLTSSAPWFIRFPILLLPAAVLLLITLPASDRLDNVLFPVLMVLAAGVVLGLVWPPFDLDLLWRIIAATAAVAVPVLNLRLIDGVRLRATQSNVKLVLLLVLNGSLLVALGMRLRVPSPLPLSAAELELGLRVSVLVAVALGCLALLTELARRRLSEHYDVTKLRLVPEAEFTQSVVWSMNEGRLGREDGERAWQQALKDGWLAAGTTPDEPSPDQDWTDTPAERGSLVFPLTWLVDLLEIHIPKALRVSDPDTNVAVGDAFRMRAAVLREWRQELVLGRPDVTPVIYDRLWATAVAAADRRWVDLPSRPAASERPLPVTGRVLTLVKPAVVIAVPAALLVYSVATGQGALAGTAGTATVLLLLEVLSPGSGKTLTSNFTDAQSALKHLPLPGGRPQTDPPDGGRPEPA